MQLLASAEFLGSFSLRARAPGLVDHAAEPRALVPRLRLGAEVVEAHRELRRPRLVEGEAESGTAPESPLRRGRARRRGRATPRRGRRWGISAGARSPRGARPVPPWERSERETKNWQGSAMEWRCGRLAARGVQRGCLLLVPRRAGCGVGGRRRRTMRWPADGSRLSDAGGEGSPTLSSSTASVRHGCSKTMEHITAERRFRRTPTWPAKCRISGSGKTLKV